MSISVKAVTACRLPSSETWKSSFVRSRTNCPCWFVTTTSTSTYSTPLRNVGACDDCAVSAAPDANARSPMSFARWCMDIKKPACLPIIASALRLYWAEDHMANLLNVAAVQASLVAEGLDAWLLYDFRGINPIAADVTAVARQPGHLATRRWYYLIPTTGEPRGLVHAIEKNSLAHLPGATERYARREQLEAGLTRLVAGVGRVAMEYSPGCAIPYIARVDAGTIELIRQCGGDGLEVVSSGDLIQRFSAIWHDDQVATHREASDKLHRVKDQAFDAIARRVRDNETTNEYEIQQLMAGWFVDEGLVADSPPNVS